MVKVSVVVPAYNMVNTIFQSVNSVLQQTCASLEVIVVDDASTDETASILATLSDPRLQIVHLPSSKGPSAARNAGIQAAKGALIALLDADDVWLPTKLAQQIALFEQNPSLGLVYCGAHMVDPALRYLRTQTTGEAWPPPGSEAFRRIALRESFIVAPLSTMVVRKECFDAVGVFDENIVQAEEWDLAFRLAHQWDIAFVPEPLVLYRMAGHFNPQKRLNRDIGQAHEITIERAFARLGNPPELDSLKIQAQLKNWWGVALYHYAMRQPDQAKAELDKIVAASPEYLDLTRNPRLKRSMAYLAWGLYDTITPLNEALAFVDCAFDHFPAFVHFERHERCQIKAQVCTITAFDSCLRSEAQRVWRSVTGAVWFDPGLLRNFGLIKLLWQVFRTEPVLSDSYLEEVFV